MNKRTFSRGFIIGVGSAIVLIALLICILPELYLFSENRNFKELREKSKLDCESMPLHCMLQENDLEGLNHYVMNGGDLELTDNWGRTAIHWALHKNETVYIPILLKAGANPNTSDEQGMSIFYRAVLWEKYDIADDLLANGADINMLNGNEYPETALHSCVMKNKLECVQYLLEHGANRHLEDSFGYTVFGRVRTHKHISKEIGEILRQ